METAADNPFAAILGDGETILWRGQPDKPLYAKGPERQLKLIVFWVLVFLCGAVLSESWWLDPKSAGWQISAFGIVVLAVTAWTMYWEVSKTPDWRYAITNKRVLFHGASGEDDAMTYLALEQIDLVQLRPKKRCDSSVVFDAQPPFKKVHFRYLADAAEVQALVVSLLLGVRQEARK